MQYVVTNSSNDGPSQSTLQPLQPMMIKSHFSSSEVLKMASQGHLAQMERTLSWACAEMEICVDEHRHSSSEVILVTGVLFSTLCATPKEKHTSTIQ